MGTRPQPLRRVVATPVVRLAEWESAPAPVQELAPADRQLAATLAERDGGRLLVEERRSGVHVTTYSWVGVVRFSNFEVRVVPKLAGGNVGIVKMLDYASGVDALRRYNAARDLETMGDDLVELIAWLFADAAADLVKGGLLSDYVAREDTLHVLRGRLKTLEQVQRQFGRVDPLEVEFDEFESDIPENQIIAAALDATRSIVRTPIVQGPIRRLHAIFHEACDPAPTDSLLLLNDLVYSRRNEHYRGAHHLARLLLGRLAVRDLLTPGGTQSFAFLLDMNQLFEDFVARLAAEALPSHGVQVHAQRRDRSIVVDESTGKGYSAIIPDLLLEAMAADRPVRLPVDAKYKLYDDRKLREADVYQAFFYAFAYASDSGGRHPARAVILYPRAGEGADAALRVDTHIGRQNARIQAFGLDIDSALRAIEDRRPVALEAIPALSHLLDVYLEAYRAASEDVEWRALSA